LDEKGPDHSKCFKISAQIGVHRYQAAWGRNKKEAEQRAARNALHQLDGEAPPPPPTRDEWVETVLRHVDLQIEHRRRQDPAGDPAEVRTVGESLERIPQDDVETAEPAPAEPAVEPEPGQPELDEEVEPRTATAASAGAAKWEASAQPVVEARTKIQSAIGKAKGASPAGARVVVIDEDEAEREVVTPSGPSEAHSAEATIGSRLTDEPRRRRWWPFRKGGDR